MNIGRLFLKILILLPLFLASSSQFHVRRTTEGKSRNGLEFLSRGERERERRVKCDQKLGTTNFLLVGDTNFPHPSIYLSIGKVGTWNTGQKWEQVYDT